MVTLPVDALYQQLSHIIWPAIRVLALFTSAPVFSDSSIPKRVKIFLALLITLLIAPQQPLHPIPIFSWQGVGEAVQQFLIGIAIGLCLQLIFVAVRTGGEIMGMQMGLSFAMMYDHANGTNMPVIARILNLFVTLLFLSFNGHLFLLSAVSASFDILPVGMGPLNSGGFNYVTHIASMIFMSGLMLSLPIVALLLLINLTLGLLNRLTPQLSIFVVGFPVTLIVGILSLSIIMNKFAPFVERLIAQSFEYMSTMLLYFSYASGMQ